MVVTGFRRCGIYPLDSMAINWSRVMPSGPRRGTSSQPPPTPSASSWAAPDVALPSQPNPHLLHLPLLPPLPQILTSPTPW